MKCATSWGSPRQFCAAQTKAAREVARAATEAQKPLQPFTEAIGGYDVARDMILSGDQLTGPMADAIRQAAIEGAQAPILETSGDPVQNEILRQAGLSVSGMTPAATQALMSQGAQGISALGDIISARQRGLEGLADLAMGSGASRATALIGQTPVLQELAAGGQEARLLGDVAGQQARTAGIETLSRLAGRII